MFRVLLALATLFMLAIGSLGVLIADDDELSGCGLTTVRNDTVRANVLTLQLALEAYANDHHGHYPPNGQLLQELTREQKTYLPNNAMPKSPWSSARQAEALPLADTDLPTARAIAKGTTPPTDDYLLGRGETPHWHISTPWQYGAILYDHDPKTNTYVLYGIGKRREKYAYIAGQATNHAPPI